VRLGAGVVRGRLCGRSGVCTQRGPARAGKQLGDRRATSSARLFPAKVSLAIHSDKTGLDHALDVGSARSRRPGGILYADGYGCRRLEGVVARREDEHPKDYTHPVSPTVVRQQDLSHVSR
jgi:hypothetical protein